MNHITNERGESVICVGSPNSHARIATKFPDSIKRAIDMRHNGMGFVFVLNNCPMVKDIPDKQRFIRAVNYYVKHKMVPAV